MANPNIVNVTSIYGNTAVANVTISSSTLLENLADSNVVIKINSIIISNIQNTSATANVGIQRSNVQYHMIRSVSIPSGSTLDALSKPLYLREGDLIFTSGSNDNAMQIICSYEEIS